jgi:hypothetical protein
MTVSEYPHHELASLGPRFVLVAPEHLAQCTRADLNPGGDRRHG